MEIKCNPSVFSSLATTAALLIPQISTAADLSGVKQNTALHEEITHGRESISVQIVSKCISFDTIEKIISSDPDLRKAQDVFKSDREKFLSKKLETGEINILKYYRLLSNVTQYRLAVELGVPQSNISKLEKLNNLDNVPFGKIKRITRILNISPEVL